MRSRHRPAWKSEPGLEAPAGRPEIRLYWVLALVAGCLLVLVLQLYRLQVIQTRELAEQSQRNCVRVHRERALRGEIRDRNGQLVANSCARFQVQILPDALPARTADRRVVFEELARLLDMDPDVVAETYRATRANPRRSRWDPVPIGPDLSVEQVSRIESQRHRLPGVEVEVGTRRNYLQGPLLTHILGQLGAVLDEDVDDPAAPGIYRNGDLIGRLGIEKTWEPNLRGRNGLWLYEVDAQGRRIRTLDPPAPIQPEPGDTLVLTIDLDLQRIADEALGQWRGTVVALDPRNGEILALVSHPGVDPNEFARGIDQARWSQIVSDPLEPMLNRAISKAFPPGSTIKPLLATAALESGVLSPHSNFSCGGSVRLTNRAWKCWKSGGHGTIDIHRAIVQSCNVFFYQTGRALDIERISSWLHAFGLGGPAGVGLDGERPGLVPDSAWKRKMFHDRWYLGETLNVSVGQGQLLVTPLQLVGAYSAIANGGELLQPRLVQRIESYDRKSVLVTERVVRGHIPISPSTRQVLLDALRGVVAEPGGTARRAEIKGLPIAGKTGTAQVAKLTASSGSDSRVDELIRDHNWFVSFAPADDPRLALVILIENGGKTGAQEKALMARQIYQRYLAPETLLAGPPTPTSAAAPVTEDEDGLD